MLHCGRAGSMSIRKLLEVSATPALTVEIQTVIHTEDQQMWKSVFQRAAAACWRSNKYAVNFHLLRWQCKCVFQPMKTLFESLFITAVGLKLINLPMTVGLTCRSADVSKLNEHVTSNHLIELSKVTCWQRCKFCGDYGASVGCVVKSCRAGFHFPCAITNGVLSQYFGEFRLVLKMLSRICDADYVVLTWAFVVDWMNAVQRTSVASGFATSS
jgi:PHD-like zinc-binding domain